MLDRNTFEQILHFHWYNWTIGFYAYVEHDTYTDQYKVFRRTEEDDEAILEEFLIRKDSALQSFLHLQILERYHTEDDDMDESISVVDKKLEFTEQEQLIINLIFKSAPLMDALLDVIKA